MCVNIPNTSHATVYSIVYLVSQYSMCNNVADINLAVYLHFALDRIAEGHFCIRGSGEFIY